ncbi:MAG: hypothetical protein RI935_702 [Candidatus Parcubacteria bacterium]|jgi:hypothetical protein
MDYLRKRSIGGIALTEGQSVLVTLFCAFVIIPTNIYFLWRPLLGIPKELLPVLYFVGPTLYLFQCIERVPVGVERAQLFFGKYTGSSFSAGFHLVPKIPFPVIVLLLKLLLKDGMYAYVGWTLEHDVSIASLTTRFEVQTLSKDMIRISVAGNLVLEVSNAARYLEQIQQNSKEEIAAIVSDIFVNTLRSGGVFKNFTLGELYQGSNAEEISRLAKTSTMVDRLEEDFGLVIARVSVAEVKVISQQLEAVTDTVIAQKTLAVSADILATMLQGIKAKNPGMTDEVALTLLNAARGESGQLPISVVRIDGR